MNSATINNFGIFGQFWARKRAEIIPQLDIGPPNGLKFALNGHKMTLKDPQQYAKVVVSTTVHYFVAVRSFLGEKCLF